MLVVQMNIQYSAAVCGKIVPETQQDPLRFWHPNRVIPNV